MLLRRQAGAFVARTKTGRDTPRCRSALTATRFFVAITLGDERWPPSPVRAMSSLPASTVSGEGAWTRPLRLRVTGIGSAVISLVTTSARYISGWCQLA